LLTGEVPSAEVRDAVEKTVAAEQNVRSVVNDLAVMPNSTIGQRSNDTFITGKVRASLVDAKDLSANSFKVVTERNVVYLMGRVSQREAGRATPLPEASPASARWCGCLSTSPRKKPQV